MFEFVDHTILGQNYIEIFGTCKRNQEEEENIFSYPEELEEHPSGLDEETARRHVFQVFIKSHILTCLSDV